MKGWSFDTFAYNYKSLYIYIYSWAPKFWGPTSVEPNALGEKI